MSFTVAGAATQPPDFAVMAMDESIADAAAGRLTTLSSCEGACSRSTALTVSSRVAATLGLPRRGTAPVRLGGSATSAGAGAVKVGLSRRVRRALGHSRGAKATLATTAGSVSLARAISLRPELGPARVASHGLKLAGICSAQCTIASRLILSGSGARRLATAPEGAAWRSAARPSMHPPPRPAPHGQDRPPSAPRPVARKRAGLTLEVTVSGPNTASRRATRRVTLG